MPTETLPQQANDILQSLIGLQPAPDSIWLFGSRANARFKPDSDTDLFVFANTEFVKQLQNSMPNNPKDVDILVVVDDDTIIYPWCMKTGSLKIWKWEFIDANSASYVGIKCAPDDDETEYDLEAYRKMAVKYPFDENDVDSRIITELNEKAIRIFPVNV